MDETAIPTTIWGLPVVTAENLAADELVIVVGRGVIRQDATLEWDGDVWIVRNIGEPYLR